MMLIVVVVDCQLSIGWCFSTTASPTRTSSKHRSDWHVVCEGLLAGWIDNHACLSVMQVIALKQLSQI